MNGGVIGKMNRASATSAAGVWNLNELYHSRLAKEWPGQLLVDVGSFAKINTVATQNVSLNGGKTWTPKAIIFFTAGSNAASGTWDPHIWQCIGFATPSTDYAVGVQSKDAVATSDTSRTMAAKSLAFVREDGTANYAEADLSAVAAGSFTLNWTSNTAGTLDATQIMYIALGGDIDAKVVNWTTPTTTTTKSITGVGFQPDLVFHASAWFSTALPLSTTDHYFGFGAMNFAGEQWMVSLTSGDNIAASNSARTSRWQRTDSCFGWMNPGGTVALRGQYVSMDADGFTTTLATADGAAEQIVSLCIKGVRSKLGSYSKPTGAAPQTQSITAPNFQPAVVMQAAYGTTSSASPVTSAVMGLGAYDGTNQRVVAQIDLDAANPTQADSIWASGKVMYTVSNGPAANSGATATGLTATGWDQTWDPNNAVAYEILYAVLG